LLQERHLTCSKCYQQMQGDVCYYKKYNYIWRAASKGKAIQLQAWTGPERSWRPSLPYFKTVGT